MKRKSRITTARLQTITLSKAQSAIPQKTQSRIQARLRNQPQAATATAQRLMWTRPREAAMILKYRRKNMSFRLLQTNKKVRLFFSRTFFICIITCPNADRCSHLHLFSVKSVGFVRRLGSKSYAELFECARVGFRQNNRCVSVGVAKLFDLIHRKLCGGVGNRRHRKSN